MANIYYRRGRYEANINLNGFPRQRKSFKIKADAIAWVTVIESEMMRSQFIDRTESERTTFKELLERYKREVTIHKRGRDTEESMIAVLIKDQIASHKVSNVTSSVMASFRDRRALQVAPATVNRNLTLLLHVLNVARREWGIHTDTIQIRRLKEPQGRNRTLTGDEEQRLMAELQATERDAQGRLTGPSNVWVKPVVQFAIETAMRQGEILEMRWEHVHIKEQYVHLPKTKNGTSRDVPLSRRAVEILQTLPARAITGLVFPTTCNAVKKFWKRACKQAGIENLRFHDLRHEATTRLSEKLPNILELSAVTGHKDLKCLKRYYNPKASELARKLG